jgi:hypothetical protein
MRTHLRLYTTNHVGLQFAESAERDAVYLLIEHSVYTLEDSLRDAEVCHGRAGRLDLGFPVEGERSRSLVDVIEQARAFDASLNWQELTA